MTERATGAGTRTALPRPLATRLIERHGDALLATARRYSLSPEDAEDAYQRGLEILLTKAPNVGEDELLPWLKTVVKHEAFAIWRSRDRAQPVGDETLEQARSAAPPPDQQVERYERLALGAEAIRRLKPQELRAMLLRADGLSYKEICEATGWTYTKVNRCLTEGRQRFLDRVAGIEAGAECDRLAPLVSALADGEATAEDLGTLRPHLRSCLACRATLREYRRVPHRTAELVPLGGAEHGDGIADAFGGWLDSAIAWLQERAGVVAAKAQAASEGASAPKIAALAASTAALAGGSVALHEIDAARGADPQPGMASEPLLETANAQPPRAARTPAASAAPEPLPVSTERPAVPVPEPAAPAVTAPTPPPPPVDEGAPPPPPANPVVAAWRAGGYGGEPPDVPDEALIPTSRSTGADQGDLDLDPLTTPWRPPQPPEEEARPPEKAPPPESTPEGGSPPEGSAEPQAP